MTRNDEFEDGFSNEQRMVAVAGELKEFTPKPKLVKIGRFIINVDDIVCVVPHKEKDDLSICPNHLISLRGGAVSAVKITFEEFKLFDKWMEENGTILRKPLEE